jgi:NCAIR mutase (PurE)-related protein
MLNSFASGVIVVNIYPDDFGVNIHPEESGDGFGAGYAASLIPQLAQS